MVEHGIGVDAGLAAFEDVVDLDVHGLRVSGFPFLEERDIHDLGRLFHDAETRAGRLAVGLAAAHAVIDALARDHLVPAQLDRGDGGGGFVQCGLDDAVGEGDHVTALAELHGRMVLRGQRQNGEK